MPPRSSTPGSLPLGEALQQSEALTRLLRRVQESKDRFEIVRPCLQGLLPDQVRPGPLDDTHWILLAANGAVAAKLRHLLPRLDDALRLAGCEPTAIRVRVQSR